LYLLGPKSKFRKVVFKLINHRVFEGSIIIMILISSILLALDDPLVNSANSTISLIDLIITIVFIVEALLKIIALGFIINGEESYLR